MTSTKNTHAYDLTKTQIQKRSQTLKDLGYDIKLKDLYTAHAKEKGYKDWDTMSAALKNRKPADVVKLESEDRVETLCKDQILEDHYSAYLAINVVSSLVEHVYKTEYQDRSAVENMAWAYGHFLCVMGQIAADRLQECFSDIDEDRFLTDTLQLLRKEWNTTEDLHNS